MANRSKKAHDPAPTDKQNKGTHERTCASTTSESQTPLRIAVFGGDGRQHKAAERRGSVRYYRSPRNGGNGDQHKLEASLRAGGVDLVLILKRWNGHSATRKICGLCDKLQVPVERLN
jgi:hypothetical protein